MKPLKEFEPILVVLGAVVAAMAYAFTTFATVKYVDDKYSEVRDDIKEVKGLVLEVLRETRKGK